VYVINMNHLAVPFPKPKQADVPDDLGPDAPSLKNFKTGRNEDSEYSYLPATDDNIAALDELMNRMDALRLQLSSFLGQESVARSLAMRTANLRLTTKPASGGTSAPDLGGDED
jgi:hypothetical protein